jgi:hypothetical protein
MSEQNKSDDYDSPSCGIEEIRQLVGDKHGTA